MLSGPKVIRSTVPRKDKARLQAFLNMNVGKTNPFGIRLNMTTLLVVMILIQINLGDNNNNNKPTAPEKNPTMLRGGLVYSMENKAGPVYVNQAFYQVTRTLSIESLANGIQATFDSFYQYRDHCNKVTELISSTAAERSSIESSTLQPNHSTVPYVVNGHILTKSIDKRLTINAPAFCKSIGGYLPEVRDKAQKERLRSFMVLNKIPSAYSGLQFDKPNMVYKFQKDGWVAKINDGSFPMTKVSYGGDWKDWDHKTHLDDGEAKHQASGYAMFYHDPEHDFRYRIGSYKDTYDYQQVICEEPFEKFHPTKKTIDLNAKKNMMIILARHACLRDLKSIEDKTKGQLNDFESLMKIKIPISPINTVLPTLTPEGLYDTDNLVRRKREIPSLTTPLTSDPTTNPTLINDPDNEQLMNLVYKIHE